MLVRHHGGMGEHPPGFEPYPHTGEDLASVLARESFDRRLAGAVVPPMRRVGRLSRRGRVLAVLAGLVLSVPAVLVEGRVLGW
jgi:hypothetical protein